MHYTDFSMFQDSSYLNRCKNSRGARKALSVAIAYDELVEKWPNESESFLHLPYTHQDPPVLKKLLVEKYDFKEEDIVILMDDGKHIRPTRAEMIRAMKRLVEGAKAGDHFVFHFSGHGSQVKNYDHTEEDGMDEVIWPLDVDYNPNAKEDEKATNFIIDDLLKEILVDCLPSNTHLTVCLTKSIRYSDSCILITSIDLPYYQSDDSRDDLWQSPIEAPIASQLPSPVRVYSSPVRSTSIDTVIVQPSFSIEDQAKRGVKRIRSMKMPHAARGHTFSHLTMRGTSDLVKHATSWSACLDDQLGIDNDTGGDNPNRTNRQLLEALSQELFEKAKMAKHYFRGEEEFQELAKVFPLPKPSLGSLQPIEKILDEPFTF
ncbi:peptidase C14 [Phellopilus nigrolimitatus]|nr:peptidase C14 [Phellopilus nigrolimitatus]